MNGEWQFDLTAAPDDHAGDVLSAWPSWPVLLPRRDEIRESRFDPAALLWADTDVFRDPFANSARVLAGIRGTLRRRRPLAGAEGEFLELCDRAAASAPPAVAVVWSDPLAYHWTRVAYQLLGACLAGAPVPRPVAPYCEGLGAADASRALALHLDRFKAFALGVAVLTGTDRPFARPLRVALPFAIPGTRRALEGEGTAEVEGFTDGRLRLKADGENWALAPSGYSGDPAPVRLRPGVVVQHDGYELLVQPAAFNVPGLEIGAPVLRAGRPFHERHAPLLEAGLGRVARYAPETFAGFRRAVRLAGLKPRDWGGFDDMSDPELPGSFVASVTLNPLEFGDHLVHEFQHNRLSFIEEYGPLFDSAPGGTDYYSPWRDKPRALYGVFHGVYVFVAVCRYWLNVHAAADTGPADRAYAVDRLLRLPRQLALAVGMLSRHARLTPMGRAILGQLGRDADAVRREVGRASLPADAPALKVAEDGTYAPEFKREDGRPITVRECLREHLRRNDTAGQCAGLADDVL